MVIREKNKKNKHVENIGTIKVLNHNQKKGFFVVDLLTADLLVLTKAVEKENLELARRKQNLWHTILAAEVSR